MARLLRLLSFKNGEGGTHEQPRVYHVPEGNARERAEPLAIILTLENVRMPAGSFVGRGHLVSRYKGNVEIAGSRTVISNIKRKAQR